MENRNSCPENPFPFEIYRRSLLSLHSVKRFKSRDMITTEQVKELVKREQALRRHL